MQRADARGDTGLVVRLARPDEYAEVGELVVAAYRAGGHLDGDDGYAAALVDVAGRAAEHPVLVAERDGVLVGSVTITPYGTPHSKDARPGEAEFRYLGVAPDAWGTGVADALVDAVESWARAQGAQGLVLSVIDWNDVAGRLYHRLGFGRAPDRDRVVAPDVTLEAWWRPVPYDGG